MRRHMRKKKKEKTLFVSYAFQMPNGFGFNNTTQFYSNSKSLTPEEIKEMEQIIKKEKKYINVTILNYHFM